jgi:hypothetical protein
VRCESAPFRSLEHPQEPATRMRALADGLQSVREERILKITPCVEKEKNMNAVKVLNCLGKSPGAIISDVMDRLWMRGLCCAMSIAIVGLSAQTPPATQATQASPAAHADHTLPAFSLAKKNEKVVINGRAWNLSELRPAWASDQKPARHTPTPSSRTRAQRLRAAPGSAQHQNH